MELPLDLDLDLNSVDTSRQIPIQGDYRARVVSADIKPNKAGTGRNLAVQFELTQNATSVQAAQQGAEGDINPGYKVTRYYPLQQSENPKAPRFEADLARLQDACLGTSLGNRPRFNPTQFVGREVIVTLRPDMDNAEFGPSCEVRGVRAIG